MSRNPFGWDYPAGAEQDPNAPWNAEDAEMCPRCGRDSTHSDSDGTWIDWGCEECGHTWLEQIGPDPDEARDAARDAELERQWEGRSDE